MLHHDRPHKTVIFCEFIREKGDVASKTNAPTSSAPPDGDGDGAALGYSIRCVDVLEGGDADRFFVL